MADDAETTAVAATELNASRSEKRRKKEKVHTKLLEMAMNAFASYLRSYPTKEKTVRHIFSARALHLGHVARSFAMKEPPKTLQKAHMRMDNLEVADNKKRKSSSLTFQEQDAEEHIIARMRPKVSRKHVAEKCVDNKDARALLHARATRLQKGGMDI
jgi:hypothetical protein